MTISKQRQAGYWAAWVMAAMMSLGPLDAFADEHAAAQPESKAAAVKPKQFVTEHSGRFNGQTVAYTATAGETFLRDRNGEPNASIFSFAYVKKDVKNAAGRPVMFLFNGGPGASSVWLHMGAFGPKRVVVPSDARDDGAPPYKIVDNTLSILDVSDIVFIDPVSTGYSHALGAAKDKDFWGVEADARAVAQFIRIWLTANNRWGSPKYLSGESYGAARAAAVVRELDSGQSDVALNGVILISAFLDPSDQDSEMGNDLAYILTLPTMAATAWYHDKAADKPSDLAAFVDSARTFARTDYAQALLQGDGLPAADRARVRKQLAQFIGLSEDYIERANLRIDPGRFQKELLRDKGLTVGRLDSRYSGVDFDRAGEFPDNDPSSYGASAAYTAALNHLMRTDLGIDMDRLYHRRAENEIIDGWDWKVSGMSPYNLRFAPYIGRAMRENAGLRVFMAAGYYDLATPFFATEYSFSHAGMPSQRITSSYYNAGHMMYFHTPDLEKLMADIRAFMMN